MKNAIYVRVSTEQQDEGMQRHSIKEFLKGMEIDYDECIEYVDHAISGTKRDRPDYQRLLSDVKNGMVNIIFCYEWSRLWRDMEEQSRALKFFKELNVKLISITEGEIKTIDDELKADLIGVLNQHERKRLLKRSADGMKSKARKCAEIMHRAIQEGWTLEQLEEHPDFWDGRKQDKKPRK
jgi:DNA invertase Pin-like site-specific DNA recombinase